MTVDEAPISTRARQAAHGPAKPRTAVLGRRARKSVLVLHIVAAGSWIGIDVLVAVLVVTGRFGGSVELRGLAYQALGTFVVGPMLTTGVLTLISGVLLGLGTKWGLLRYWWVAVKLVLAIVLCTLIVVALRPGMADVAAYGANLSADAPVPASIDTLFFPPAVSLSALTFATVLSVVKPWGRLRRGARRR